MRESLVVSFPKTRAAQSLGLAARAEPDVNSGSATQPERTRPRVKYRAVAKKFRVR